MEFMTKYFFFKKFVQYNEKLPQQNHCLGSLQLILNLEIEKKKQ
jgi:hypothetical protein